MYKYIKNNIELCYKKHCFVRSCFVSIKYFIRMNEFPIH